MSGGSRRGQVALEFLTTYGWAVLIILVMIGAISYFGIVNPSKLLPSKCVVGSELSCTDYLISQDGIVSLQLRQVEGQTVYLSSATCSYEASESTIDFSGAAWSPRDTQLVACDLGKSLSALKGQKIKVFFEVVYTKSVGGFAHPVTGELYAEVQ